MSRVRHSIGMDHYLLHDSKQTENDSIQTTEPSLVLKTVVALLFLALVTGVYKMLKQIIGIRSV